jgi:hypothetical protein
MTRAFVQLAFLQLYIAMANPTQHGTGFACEYERGWIPVGNGLKFQAYAYKSE